MIAIVCVDQKNGMLFNHRRQSQDREVRRDILEQTKGKKLWMNEYSYKQFARGAEGENKEGGKNLFCNGKNDLADIVIDADFVEKAGSGEYCFIENQKLAGLPVEKLVLYRWDKVYPAEVKLDIDLKEWRLEEQSEFQGYSHKIIGKEVYERNKG